MAKSIPTKVFAAIPPRHYDDVIFEVLALKHSQDHIASAAFPVVAFAQGAVGKNHCPAVVGGFGVFLGPLEVLEKCFDSRIVGYAAARGGIARAAITDYVFDLQHRVNSLPLCE